MGLSRLGAGEGIAGSGELCTLEFTVVGTGDAGLEFTRAGFWSASYRSCGPASQWLCGFLAAAGAPVPAESWYFPICSGVRTVLSLTSIWPCKA